jgi:hypothetical protein
MFTKNDDKNIIFLSLGLRMKPENGPSIQGQETQDLLIFETIS